MADGGGGNKTSSSSEEHDLGASIYRAVASGQSEEHVRRLIEQCGSEERRKAAVNASFEREGGGEGDGDQRETPLQAAHRLERGDLVGALLEAGADAAKLYATGHTTAIVLCIYYDLPSTLRVLLRSGKHRADEQVAYWPWSTLEGETGPQFKDYCTPAHLCVTPPRRRRTFEPWGVIPRLDCLEVLVREFGADVNGRDKCDRTPLAWLAQAGPDHAERALDVLLSLGADIEAKDPAGETPLFSFAHKPRHEIALRLLARGASANVISHSGYTPLSSACFADVDDEDEVSPELVSALLRASSPETRRARDHEFDDSALDMLITYAPDPLEPWRYPLIRELLAGGVPLKPEVANKALRMGSRYANKLEAQVAARSRRPMTWRGHEGMVRLAFDMRDKREADERLRATEKRLDELERELSGRQNDEDEQQEQGGSRGEEEEEGASGSGSGSGSGDGDENDHDEGEDDEDDGPWW